MNSLESVRIGTIIHCVNIGYKVIRQNGLRMTKVEDKNEKCDKLGSFIHQSFHKMSVL